jgi:hypothetical protein
LIRMEDIDLETIAVAITERMAFVIRKADESHPHLAPHGCMVLVNDEEPGQEPTPDDRAVEILPCPQSVLRKAPGCEKIHGEPPSGMRWFMLASTNRTQVLTGAVTPKPIDPESN